MDLTSGYHLFIGKITTLERWFQDTFSVSRPPWTFTIPKLDPLLFERSLKESEQQGRQSSDPSLNTNMRIPRVWAVDMIRYYYSPDSTDANSQMQVQLQCSVKNNAILHETYNGVVIP